MQNVGPIFVLTSSPTGQAHAAALSAQGYEARAVDPRRFHLPAILDARPRAVVLEGDPDGLEQCRALRAHYPGGIVLQLPTRAPAHEVEAIDAGADDVIEATDPEVLLVAKVRRLFRRSEPKPSAAPRLELDRAERRARFEGHELDLTDHELDILAALVDRGGEVVTRQELYLTVRGTEYDGLERGIDVHVSRIRAKLKSAGLNGRAIKAIRGAGYAWVADQTPGRG